MEGKIKFDYTATILVVSKEDPAVSAWAPALMLGVRLQNLPSIHDANLHPAVDVMTYPDVEASKALFLAVPTRMVVYEAGSVPERNGLLHRLAPMGLEVILGNAADINRAVQRAEEMWNQPGILPYVT